MNGSHSRGLSVSPSSGGTNDQKRRLCAQMKSDRRSRNDCRQSAGGLPFVPKTPRVGTEGSRNGKTLQSFHPFLKAMGILGVSRLTHKGRNGAWSYVTYSSASHLPTGHTGNRPLFPNSGCRRAFYADKDSYGAQGFGGTSKVMHTEQQRTRARGKSRDVTRVGSDTQCDGANEGVGF